jgi:type I restriction enzyme S subunit
VLKIGDLVFSRVGAIDRCSYVREQENGWLFSGRCLRVRCGKNINSKFLSYQLNQERAKNWILNNAVGSTMPCLNTTILSNLPIMLPKLDEQEKIAKVLDAHLKNIKKENEKLKKLLKLKTALMQDLLTGRVRVTELLKKRQAEVT